MMEGRKTSHGSRIVDEDKLNKSVRAFLKKVGITSQREIEKAVRERAEDGRLAGTQSVEASVVLRVPELDLELEIRDDLELD